MSAGDADEPMSDRDKLSALYDVLARNVIDISHLTHCVTRLTDVTGMLTDVTGMLADTVHELYAVVENLYTEPVETQE